ncbi:MAG TPA: Hpt domain-containing protein [Rhizomicrobium sp.]|jgi:chemotaxis protein histidine kinase CheA
MSKKHPIEIFMPPNILKAKVGGSIAALDMAAIRRAEAAVDDLKEQFQDWIGDDVEKLAAARNAFAADRKELTRDTLFRSGHDLKGQGQTFGFPIVARVAASLCRMLDGTAVKAIPLGLVDAHVDAIRVCMRDQIKGDGDSTALMLAKELEARVTELITPAALAAR